MPPHFLVCAPLLGGHKQKVGGTKKNFCRRFAPDELRQLVPPTFEMLAAPMEGDRTRAGDLSSALFLYHVMHNFCKDSVTVMQSVSRLFQNFKVPVKNLLLQDCKLMCPKCTKTHIRASVDQKKNF